MHHIYPSLLATDLSALKDEIKVLSQLPIAGLHWDVMDRHFVPNLSFGMDVITQCRPHTTLPFHVHLMVTHPQHYLEACARAQVDTVFVHQECPTEAPDVLLQKIRALGMKAGLVINPKTPFPHVRDADAVLLMSVEPGFAGQSFLPEVLPKMTQARTMLGDDFPIFIDGGMNPETIALCRQKDMHHFVVGHALLKGAYHEHRLAELQERLAVLI